MGYGLIREIDLSDDLNSRLDGNDTMLQSHATSLSDITQSMTGLGENNLASRKEIMDIKLKLKEQSAINFLNKTGIGFYDTFEDDSNIDTLNTDATFDGTNKLVNFPPLSFYTGMSSDDYTGVTAINVKTDNMDQVISVGDKLDNSNAILTSVSTSATYDRTTPVTIISGGVNKYHNKNAPPQVLSNGWIVNVYLDDGTATITFYVSKDNGETWSQLCYITGSTSLTYIYSMTSYGTNIYFIRGVITQTAISFVKFDATTVSNTALTTSVIGYASFIGSDCSIRVSPTGVLTVAWVGTTSTSYSSYSVFSRKSIDGVSWTKQDGTEGTDTVVAYNSTSSNGYISCMVCYNSSNYPVINCGCVIGSPSYAVRSITFNGLTWATPVNVISGSDSPQSPSIMLQKYGTHAGRLWCVWYGTDTTDTATYNIRVSYSDNNGTTWSTPVKLTSGNTYWQKYASIVSDANGNVYVIWQGETPAYPSTYNVRMIKYDGTSWGSITEVTSQSNGLLLGPIVCDNYYNFSYPLIVSSSNTTGKTTFVGKWGVSTFDITLTSAVTLTKGQALTIYAPSKRTLAMREQDFESFDNLELILYPSKINKATISGDVNDSTNVVIGDTDKSIVTGDRLLLNGDVNTVVDSVSNFTTYNRTTPISVINSAYITNARPQVLGNGWVITMVANSTTSVIFYVSKDNGATWTLLTTWTINASGGFSMCSYGNTIFAIAVVNGGTTVPLIKFDATTVGTTITSSINLDSSQSAFGLDCSIAVSSTGVLTAVWCSKNTTYATSYNLRSVKSGDGGATWTKQDGTTGVDQVTTIPSPSSYYAQYPYVIYDKNNKPIIFSGVSNASAYSIVCIQWSGTTWGTMNTIYSGGSSYNQYSPVATLQKYGLNAGRIWVAWYGCDATDTTKQNIRVSYSDNNGTTWSTPVKLTSGNTYNQMYPCVTSDINGNVYVMWQGVTLTNSTYYNVRMIKYDGTSWGSITELTSQNTASMQNPSMCDNYNNFEKPIIIWQDNQNTRVAFYGKFTVGEGYTLTMQNPVMIADGQEVNIVDLVAQQNGVDLELNSIDSEKFVYTGNNLATTNASISIIGKDNDILSLVYAIS